MFIDGLNPAIRALIARGREDVRDITYLELVHLAKSEVDALHARRLPDRRVKNSMLIAEPDRLESLSILRRQTGTPEDNLQLA